MTHEKTTPLRERMIEDMRIHGMGDKAQKAHIRAIKDFAGFLKGSPDTATPDDLRAYQLHMTDTGVTPPTTTRGSWRCGFCFGKTCGREEMKKYMQFRTQPRKLPTVLSIEDVSELLAAAPGPGLKYRAALSISYGAGLRASEVCNLKVSDIDSDRMLIHVDEGKGRKDRKVMLSPDLLDLLRDYWCEARPEGWLFPGKPKINPVTSRQLGRAFNSAKHLVGISKAGYPAYLAAQLCHPPAGSGDGCPGHPGASRPRQAEHNSTLHPGRHQDDPGYAQPVRSPQEAEHREPASTDRDKHRPVAQAKAGDR